MYRFFYCVYYILVTSTPTDVTFKPFSDLAVSMLNSKWLRCVSCSDSPYRLVANRNVDPLFSQDLILNCDKHPLNDLLGFTCLPLQHGLTDTQYHFHAIIQGSLDLCSYICVRFLKMYSSLTVTDDGPFAIHINELWRSDLACVITSIISRHILCTDLNFVV